MNEKGGNDMQSSNVVAMKKFSAAPSADILNAWESVYKKLREGFGEGVYRSWLKPMQLQAYYEGTMEISVPTRFMRDILRDAVCFFKTPFETPRNNSGCAARSASSAALASPASMADTTLLI